MEVSLCVPNVACRGLQDPHNFKLSWNGTLHVCSCSLSPCLSSFSSFLSPLITSLFCSNSLPLFPFPSVFLSLPSPPFFSFHLHSSSLFSLLSFYSSFFLPFPSSFSPLLFFFSFSPALFSPLPLCPAITLPLPYFPFLSSPSFLFPPISFPGKIGLGITCCRFCSGSAMLGCSSHSDSLGVSELFYSS